MADLFISYARADKVFARKVHDALIAAGHNVWVDWEDIPPTAEWLKEITTAIDRADTVVFVVSTASIASATCGQEISHAADRHKRLVPIVTAAISPDIVHPAVAKVQWIFCGAGDDFDASMAEVLRAIDLDLEWVRAHTRLLTRALEWQDRGRDSSVLLRGNDLRNAEESVLQASDKEPKLVAAQQEFVTASRRAANTRQRTTVGVLVAGVVVTTGLAVFALVQRHNAIAQRDEARRQRTMVLGRQLAAQSEVVRTRSPNLLDRSVLLAIEASRRASGPDIDRALRDSVGILPTLLSERHQARSIQGVSISTDGALCAAGGDDGIARLWQCATSQEMWQGHIGQSVSGVLFSPDGTALAIAGAGGVILHAVSSSRDVTLSTVPTGVITVSGNLLAAGSTNGRITIWRIVGGDVAAEFAAGSAISALSFSPDARLLASGADDNTVRVWNIEGGREIMRGRHEQAAASMPLRLGSRDGGVFAVAFDPRGRWVASGGQDRAVKIHDVTSGRELFRAYQSDSVYSVAFSPDGRWLASGGMDETARVWSLDNQSERYRLVHEYVVQKVLWSRAGNLLTVSGDGTGRLWNMNTGTELSRMFDPGYLSDAALSGDGSRAVTGSWDGFARAWQLTGAGGATLQLPHSEAREANYSPDGKWLATIGEDQFVQLWSLPAGTPTFRFTHAPFTSSARFSPDSTKLVTTGWDGLVHIWNVSSGKELGAGIRHQGRVVDARFSPDGKVIATAGFEDGTAIVIDAVAGTELYRVHHPGVLPNLRMAPGVRSITFSPDAHVLATGGQDGVVRLWDVASGRETQRFVHAGYIMSAAFTPDAHHLITDADDSVSVWALPSGTRLATISKKAENDPLMSLLGVSRDGRLVLVGSVKAHSVQVRTIPELQLRASLLHDDDVFSAAFNREGTLVLTGSRDKTARLWDARTWQEVARVAASGFVYVASFSPDERAFVTASGDGFVRIWEVEASAMAATACKRLRRNLSPDEWRQYVGMETYSRTCGP